jgi:hypothetical protein
MLTIAAWDDPNARFTAQTPALPPPPAPGQVLGPFTAVGSVRAGFPASTVSGADKISETQAIEESVAAYQGIFAADANDGDPVFIYHAGPCPLFAGLNTAPAAPDTAEYFIYGPFPPVLASGVPPGAWHRSVGSPFNATTLNLRGGSAVVRKPLPGQEAMPVKQNASGHFEPDTTVSTTRQGNFGEAIGSGVKALYIKESDGKLYLLDGDEDNVDNYAGLSDGAAHLINTTGEYYPPGVPLSHASLAGLSPGDIYAKDDGTLFDSSDSAAMTAMSGKWSRIVADHQNGQSVQVVYGEVKLF